jgi:transcription elongation factor Elf1
MGIVLKKCPVCNGSATLHSSIQNRWFLKHKPTIYWVRCDECRAMTMTFESKTLAVGVWNKANKEDLL